MTTHYMREYECPTFTCFYRLSLLLERTKENIYPPDLSIIRAFSFQDCFRLFMLPEQTLMIFPFISIRLYLDDAFPH